LKGQQIGTKPMVNRNTLLKKLKKRYNMVHNTNIIYNVTSLPNSCAMTPRLLLPTAQNGASNLC
jgi:hypothetical protein